MNIIRTYKYMRVRDNSIQWHRMAYDGQMTYTLDPELHNTQAALSQPLLMDAPGGWFVELTAYDRVGCSYSSLRPPAL